MASTSPIPSGFDPKRTTSSSDPTSNQSGSVSSSNRDPETSRAAITELSSPVTPSFSFDLNQIKDLLRSKLLEDSGTTEESIKFINNGKNTLAFRLLKKVNRKINLSSKPPESKDLKTYAVVQSGDETKLIEITDEAKAKPRELFDIKGEEPLTWEEARERFDLEWAFSLYDNGLDAFSQLYRSRAYGSSNGPDSKLELYLSAFRLIDKLSDILRAKGSSMGRYSAEGSLSLINTSIDDVKQLWPELNESLLTSKGDKSACDRFYEQLSKIQFLKTKPANSELHKLASNLLEGLGEALPEGRWRPYEMKKWAYSSGYYSKQKERFNFSFDPVEAIKSKSISLLNLAIQVGFKHGRSADLNFQEETDKVIALLKNHKLLPEDYSSDLKQGDPYALFDIAREFINEYESENKIDFETITKESIIPELKNLLPEIAAKNLNKRDILIIIVCALNIIAEYENGIDPSVRNRFAELEARHNASKQSTCTFKSNVLAILRPDFLNFDRSFLGEKILEFKEDGQHTFLQTFSCDFNYTVEPVTKTVEKAIVLEDAGRYAVLA